MSYKSLIINPAFTSTKIGVFDNEPLLCEETLRHPTDENSKYATIIDQKDFIFCFHHISSFLRPYKGFLSV